MLQYLIPAMFKFFVLSFMLFAQRSYGADYRFEACVPSDCGGVSISYPFYIPGQQESYCGYPGFELSCPNNIGFPILKLHQNDYVVKQISYQEKLFRVYDAVFLNLNDSVCIPSIKNTTLPTQFEYVNVTNLHFFPNCSKNLTSNLWPYRVICQRIEGDYWDLKMNDNDVNLRYALENCETHVVAPVDVSNEHMNIYGALRWGFLLNWVASDCSPCEKSGGRCGFNETSYHFSCFCPDRSHSRMCDNPVGVSPTAALPTEALPPLTDDPISKKEKNRKKLILATGASVALLIVTAISIILFIFIRKKLLKLPGIPKAKTETQMDIKLFLKNHGNLAPKIYKYSELKKITNSFSDSLGKGGCGSVYKGELQDGCLVAVKILNESKGNGEEFMNEVASIGRTSHVNIVTLLGFCLEGSKRALVYEFLPNGSLEKYIPNTASSTAGLLGWKKLFEITLGIARGLEYLHQGCSTRILHFDIKPHNILLDKDMKPKISDFGLAKLCPNRSSIISMLGARGTAGYIAPEVFCRNFGEVSHKSDIYSYGMMVLELVLGRKNIDPQSDRSSEVDFTGWIYNNLEPNVETSHAESIFVEEDEWQFAKKKLIIIGLWCIQTEPKNRPSISRVIEMLEEKVESLQVPPRPYLSSSPRSIASFSASDSS